MSWEVLECPFKKCPGLSWNSDMSNTFLIACYPFSDILSWFVFKISNNVWIVRKSNLVIELKFKKKSVLNLIMSWLQWKST